LNAKRSTEIDQIFTASSGSCILETAEETEIELLPYSCRQSASPTCTANLVCGAIEQSEESYPSKNQIAEDCGLICITHPKADCVFEIHKKEGSCERSESVQFIVEVLVNMELNGLEIPKLDPHV
jgi:ferredoxin